mgnify:FL=1
MTRFGKICAVILLALSLALPAAPACEADGGVVMAARLEGTVGVSMEVFTEEVLSRASDEGAGLVVFRMDTPGGLVSSMRAMTAAIMDSSVPVVVWVSPQGARAASAGAFLLQAAHVAAMAPGTNVGAAHPGRRP